VIITHGKIGVYNSKKAASLTSYSHSHLFQYIDGRFNMMGERQSCLYGDATKERVFRVFEAVQQLAGASS
jgi:hypothetical protein